MMKLLKWIVGLLVTLLVLIIVAIIVVTTYVNPNRFKPLIIQQVKSHTGRDLNIVGDLSWSFYPTLGVRAGKTQLHNPAGFTEPLFAEMQSATVSVALLPLLHGKVESSGIELRGLILNLIKNANGKTNWQDLQQKNSAAGAKHVSVTSQIVLPRQPVVVMFAVAKIDVVDATIHCIDEVAKKSMEFRSVNFHAKDITLDHSFPVAVAFDFATKNPISSGHLNVTTHVNLQVDKALYTFSQFAGALLLQQNAEQITIPFSTNILIDMRHDALRLNEIVIKAKSMTMTGNVAVMKFTVAPQITAKMNANNVQLEQFFKEFGFAKQKLQLAGTGNIALQITTAAKDPIANLNGSGSIDFSQAAIKGLDIGYYVETAYKLANLQVPRSAGSEQTTVGNLTGTFTLQKGVLSNHDLLLDSPRFVTKAKGTVNLNNQQLAYLLEVSVKQLANASRDWKNLYGVVIPITVKGDLHNPTIHLESDALVKAAVTTAGKQQLEKLKSKAIDKINDQLKDKLPDGANQLLNNLLH